MAHHRNIKKNGKTLKRFKMLGQFELQFGKHTLYSHVFTNDNFISTTVRFHVPEIKVFKFQKDTWNEWFRELGFSAPTILIWHKSDYFWSLNVRLFGFGVSLAHQNGY